jgi:hypothetical protein
MKTLTHTSFHILLRPWCGKSRFSFNRKLKKKEKKKEYRMREELVMLDQNFWQNGGLPYQSHTVSVNRCYFLFYFPVVGFRYYLLLFFPLGVS